ncbi:vacuolar protein sorting-associated protein 33B isoform X2 [Venturia canescens]|uniref:vacuolar protein sorting-associated protein 33B isoform X2 n=1 Tax=Venturia canescens TaxID=32260 RepID=UPI001C9D49CE|nr:vacuolar protein sorting-associated protein 33B isoform X2 [Venturia canescens]
MLGALQQISQRKLVDILDSIVGKKDLVIEQKLFKILESFIGATVLKQHGVDKIFKFEAGLKPSNTQRIFLVSGDLIACKRVLDQIQSELMQAHGLAFHVLVAPHVPAVVRSLVEEEGLAELVTLYSLSWEFIQLDGNVLSLEYPMFANLYYHKDTGLLPAMARCLWSMQLVLGAPRLTLSFGKHSENILKMIESMRESSRITRYDKEIGCLVLMDRNYDLVSTFLTPVSYVGLVSEVLPLSVGTATLDSSKIKLDPKKDRVYGDVRDIHFSDVFPKLRAMAKSLKSEQESTQTMELADMTHYVSTRLHEMVEVKAQLASHISACEAIVGALGSDFEALQFTEKSILDCARRKECLDYIEKNIDDHPMRSLRLLCLLSQTSDGVTQSEWQPIQKSHLHAHGYRHIPLIHKLETSGLLRRRRSMLRNKLPNWNSEWTTNAQRLKLLPGQSKRTDSKTSGTACPSYVFSSNYIPAIAQFLNIILNQTTDPRSFEDLINLPGCLTIGSRGHVQPKTVVMCIIGGITFAEISACRLIERSTGIRLVLISDTILTGNKLIESIQDS